MPVLDCSPANIDTTRRACYDCGIERTWYQRSQILNAAHQYDSKSSDGPRPIIGIDIDTATAMTKLRRWLGDAAGK